MATLKEKLFKQLKKAIQKQDSDTVRRLVAEGLDVEPGDGTRWIWQRSPLELAYELRNIEIGEILLKAGADPNIKVHTEGGKYPGPSLLSHAIENRMNNFLSLLFDCDRLDPEFGGVYDSYRIRRGRDKPPGTKRPSPLKIARATGRDDIIVALESRIAEKRRQEGEKEAAAEWQKAEEKRARQLDKADRLRNEATQFRRQADELTAKAAHFVGQAEEIEKQCGHAPDARAQKRKFKI